MGLLHLAPPACRPLLAETQTALLGARAHGPHPRWGSEQALLPSSDACGTAVLLSWELGQVSLQPGPGNTGVLGGKLAGPGVLTLTPLQG